jgi:hypothetical protein
MSPRHSAVLVGFLAVGALIAFTLGWSINHFQLTSIAHLPQRYAIPPTFGNNRVFYGVVLGLLMLGNALAFGAFIENIRFLLVNPSRSDSPAKVTVVNETVLLVFILLATVPDVLVLLSWGERGAPTYYDLSRWDRAFDGFAIFILIGYILRRLRSRPTLLFQLQREPIPVDLEPSWQQLRPKLLIGLVVTIISFGVAFAK